MSDAAAARAVLWKAGWTRDQIDELLPDRAPRRMPANHDAEQSVLGGLFFRNDVLKLLPDLEVDDFHNPKNQLVYSTILNLDHEGTPFDPITVDAELKRTGKSESMGGLAYLAELSLRVPSLDNILHYAEIVKGLATQRKYILAASTILDDSFRIDDEEFFGGNGIQKGITRLMSIPTRARDAGRTVGQLMRDVLASVERDLIEAERVEAAGETAPPVGVPTGITGIDIETGGCPYGMVSLIIGGTGHGKSTVIGTSASAASDAEYIVLIYALEDIGKFWGERSLARATGIPTEQISRRRFTDPAFVRKLFETGMVASAARKEVVIPAAGWTAEEIVFDARSRRHRIQAQSGSKKKMRCAAYIDYAQILKLKYSRGVETKTQALANAMDTFQWLAQGCGSDDEEDQYAVIVGSQVTEKPAMEKRGPTIEDVSDCRHIGKVAKYALGVNRPATYDASADPLLGQIDLLKRSQGNASLAVQVTLDLATHSIRDCRDRVTYDGRDSYAERMRNFYGNQER